MRTKIFIVLILFSLFMQQPAHADDSGDELYSELQRYSHDMSQQLPAIFLPPNCRGVTNQAACKSCEAVTKKYRGWGSDSSISAQGFMHDYRNVEDDGRNAQAIATATQAAGGQIAATTSDAVNAQVNAQAVGNSAATAWSKIRADLVDAEKNLDSCMKAADKIAKACTNPSYYPNSQAENARYTKKGCSDHLKQIQSYITTEDYVIAIVQQKAKMAGASATALGSLKAGYSSSTITSGPSAASATSAGVLSGAQAMGISSSGAGVAVNNQPIASGYSSGVSGNATGAAASVLPNSALPPCANGYARDEDGICPAVSDAPANCLNDRAIAYREAYNHALSAGKNREEADSAGKAAAASACN